MSVENVKVLSGPSIGRQPLASPSEILRHKRVRKDALGRFGAAEVEEAAWKLTTFLAFRATEEGYDGWVSFTLIQAMAYYKKRGWDPNLVFYGLVGGSSRQVYMECRLSESPVYLVLDELGCYAVTNLFVAACLAR